jgi:hypothetical protein
MLFAWLQCRPGVVVLSEIAQEFTGFQDRRRDNAVSVPRFGLLTTQHQKDATLFVNSGTRWSGLRARQLNVTRQLRRHNDSCDASSAHV